MPSVKLPARLIGINTKMYFDYHYTTSYITDLSELAPPSSTSSSLGLFVIPSSPFLTIAASILKSTPHILLGAQNCHYEDSGPYTGEVSPLVLRQLGCSIVLLGHAGRRAPPINENNEMVAEKARAVARNGMIPLVCIGERKSSNIMSEGVGIAIQECLSQVSSILRGVPDGPLIFAYEPVWAIGAQQPASADHVTAVTRSLKDFVRAKGGERECRILYGGSAGPGTWESLKEDVDGLFLGRFAHDVEKFEEVVREVERS